MKVDSVASGSEEMLSPFAGLTAGGRGEFLSCESGRITENTSCQVCYAVSVGE